MTNVDEQSNIPTFVVITILLLVFIMYVIKKVDKKLKHNNIIYSKIKINI
jgi:hypothetical protein